jgi:hypothetical protein
VRRQQNARGPWRHARRQSRRRPSRHGQHLHRRGLPPERQSSSPPSRLPRRKQAQHSFYRATRLKQERAQRDRLPARRRVTTK